MVRNFDTLYEEAQLEPTSEGCFLWPGAKHKKTGYGLYSGKYAHRLAWEREIGTIPEGLTIDHVGHRFETRRCVNVDHMEVVTRTENAMRGNSPIADNARKTHCLRGHELIGDNLIVRKKSGRAPSRECRTCKRAAENRRYHARHSSE